MNTTVFVAENHPDARWAIIDSLTHTAGFEVLPPDARNREFAYKLPREIKPTLDLIYGSKPDVVVMDIWWPPDRSAGIWASRQIKDKLPTTRILLYSQYVEADLVVHAALEGGVDGYVSKDEYPSNLLPAAIRTIRRGLPYFVPEVVDQLLRIIRKDMVPTVVDRLLADLQESKSESERSVGLRLSETESKVLKRMARGERNAAIARNLSLSESSVKGLVHQIYEKLGVREAFAETNDVELRVMAVLIGVREGYVTAEDLMSTGRLTTPHTQTAPGR